MSKWAIRGSNNWILSANVLYPKKLFSLHLNFSVVWSAEGGKAKLSHVSSQCYISSVRPDIWGNVNVYVIVVTYDAVSKLLFDDVIIKISYH